MATAKLTKRSIDALEARVEGDYFVWDAELKGFGVRVTPLGRKVFVLGFRPQGARQFRRVTLGAHGVLTFEQARRMAQQQLGAVAGGSDPAADRRARRESPTVADFGGVFLADVQARRKATTAREYARMWSKHVIPALGTRKLEDVSAGDMRKLHRAMRETPYAANRCLAMLGSAFALAEREGVRPRHSNPARDVEPYPESARERFLSHAERVRLGEALARAERDGLPPAPEHRRRPSSVDRAKHRPKAAGVPIPASPAAVAALRLLYFTGCREQEILALRWEDVDLGGGFLRLSDTKTGRSIRPLNAPAREILASVPRHADSPWVFPSPVRPAMPLREIRRLWHSVRHAAELVGVRLHDFRHTTASVLAEQGASLLEIGAVLGHRNANTTRRYAHLVEDHIKSWSERAGDELRAGLLGHDTQVIPIRGRA